MRAVSSGTDEVGIGVDMPGAGVGHEQELEARQAGAGQVQRANPPALSQVKASRLLGARMRTRGSWQGSKEPEHSCVELFNLMWCG